VWFHGGGFVLGSIASHDGVCRALASQAGIVVASVEYRLAPEHPFPAGLEDAIAVTRWILARGEVLGIDPRAVAVGGDSAGGNFATGAALACRGDALQPRFQVLVYPATDATRSEPSHRFFHEGFLITGVDIAWYLDHYITDPRLATDPRVSPVLTPNLAGSPPALVLTAGFDPLRDEGRLYARRLAEAGVPVESLCAEGSLHGFLNTAGAIEESARLLALAADRLRRRLYGPAARGPSI
jgi:acetyl esterase